MKGKAEEWIRAPKVGWPRRKGTGSGRRCAEAVVVGNRCPEAESQAGSWVHSEQCGAGSHGWCGAHP